MEFRLLGPLEVWEGPTPVPLTGFKLRGLLAVLVLEAGRVVSADRLVSAVWGSDGGDASSNTLQVHVSQLRRTLQPGHVRGAPGELVVTRPPGYVLQLRPGDRVDAIDFERLAADGHARLLSDPQAAHDVLVRALALWRGPVLTDLASLPIVRGLANRLDELRLGATEDRIQAALALGGHRAEVPELEALVAEHPLRERLRGLLMLALYRCGRQADALAVMTELRRRLVEDLGIDPGAELTRLERSILVQDPELEAPVDVASNSATGPDARRGGPAPGPAAPPGVLEVRAPHRREVLILANRCIRIGRGSSNDLVLDGDATVSRHHAQVLPRDGQWWLCDLGSSNGTSVGGRRVDRDVALNDGDEIAIGSARLRLRVADTDTDTIQLPHGNAAVQLPPHPLD